jgi:alkylglycerol monooxygenase
MMGENKYLWIAAAAVLFVIGMEYLYARSERKIIFRFQNTISNLLMGIFDRIAGVFMVPLIYIYYEYLYENLALFSIPETWMTFLFSVVVSDFIWYFYHRAGHRINMFWGAHIIHHQSEDYNYSVALNLTPFQVIIRVLFWSLMPILGFTAETVLATHVVIGLYQFVLHTTLIPKLGWIEKLFVTPSHHRVHHGSNTQYLDKNYGGVLIVWDHIFGTFQEEEEAVSYGITKDINTRDFLMSVFHYYKNLIFKMKQLSTWKEKGLLLVKGPDWVPVSGPLKDLSLYIPKGSYHYGNYTVWKKIYIVFNVVFLFSVLLAFAFYLNLLDALQLSLTGLFLLVSLIAIGRMLEGLKTKYLEFFRLFLVFSLLYTFF